jgi:hypothetical protein
VEGLLRPPAVRFARQGPWPPACALRKPEAGRVSPSPIQSILGPSGTGTRGHTKKAGERNQEEIRVKGTRWTVTINRAIIVDADIATVKDLEALARRTKAPLGVLGHGGRVEVHNLRVKDL